MGEPSGYPDLFAVVRRSALFLRRTLNQGVGLILLGIVFLSLATILSRVGYTAYMRYTSEVANQIRDMLAPNEPRRDDPRPGVVAAVLSPINGTPDSLTQLPEFQSARSAATDLHARFLGWVEQLRRLRLGHQGDEVRLDQLRGIVEAQSGYVAPPTRAEVGAMDERLEMFREILTRLIALPQGSEPATLLSLGLVPSSTAETVSSRERSLGVSWTDGDKRFGGSALMVPATVLRGVGAPPRFDTADRASLTVDPRVAEAVDLSRLFDLSQAGAYGQLQSDSFTLSQSYFISVDSVLRLSPAPHAHLRTFPPARLWASAYYVERLMHGTESDYLSPAYLDFAGRGVVVTLATPVLGEEVEVDASGQLERRFLGVVGTDIQIPEERVLDALGRHPWLFRPERIDFSISDTITTENIDRLLIPKPQSWWSMLWFPPNDTEDPWVSGGESRKREVAAWIDHALRSSETSVSEVARRVTTLNDAHSFLVPLGSYQAGRFHGVLLTPKAPAFPVIWITLAIVSLCAFVVCTFQGAVLARRSARIADQASILRGLMVGVMLVDEEERVLGANDRAEDLFDTSIPKYGTAAIPGGTDPKLTFDTLIDERVAAYDDAGGETLVAKSYMDTIPRMRADGQPSTYFARARRTGVVLKVTAAPMLTASRQRRLTGSFGVLEPVEDVDLVKKVNKCIDPPSVREETPDE